jgi:acetyl-CoA carboxylase biotin carboxyl carrier protein
VDVKAEMNAIVWKIEVEAGARVAADDVIMILESMKMEIPVTAPIAGRLGTSVTEDDVLAVIDPD